tara:strand:- start:7539 stop:8156 length:618 start_codon:yes stop_codon:yes gene_type:complete
MSRRIMIPMFAMTVTGCVSVLPEPVTPDGLYRLTSASDELKGDAPLELPGNITVFEPSGSNLLLSNSIVFEDETGALSLLSTAQWSDPVSRQLQSALIDRLTLRQAPESGLAFNDTVGAEGDFELQWEVRDLVLRSDEAVVSLRGVVSHFRTGQLAPFSVTVRETYSGKAGEAGVPALIEATREAVDELAENLPKLMTLSSSIER